MTYLIGVDIGTQGTKTMLYDLEGNCIANAFERSNLITKNGTLYQDADEIYFSVINTIKSVVEKSSVDPSDIAGIAMDSQMAGTMGIDENFNAVTYYDSWLDNTCKDYIDIIKNMCNDRVVELTGSVVSNLHGPKILWWKNERPEIYRQIKKFVMPAVYVAGRMAALKSDDAVMDYTYIHFSGFADNKNMQWSDELLDAFDVDKDKMPRITSPFEIIGNVKKTAAQQTGLKDGTPIVAGCGDTAATCFGAGVVEAGQAIDVAGTASVFACCVDDYKPDVENGVFFNMRSVVGGRFMPLAYIGGGGLCIRWFKETFTGAEHADYDTLQREALDVMPGSEGVRLIPHFEGRVCPSNPKLKGSFSGIGFHTTRAHFYRAIMEGIAYEYRYYYETMKLLGYKNVLKEIYGVGGGAKSVLFNQIKADVLGIPYTSLKVTDCATTACAVIAGVGVGVYNDAKETILSMNTIAQSVQPDISNREVYQKGFEDYIATTEALEKVYNE